MKNKLENIDKNRPFKVPDNYFDTFQSRMADRIAMEQSKKQIQPVLTTSKLRLVPIFAAASVILIIISIVLIIPKTKKYDIPANQLAEIYRYQAIESTSETDLMKELEIVTKETTKKDSILTKKDVFTDEAINDLSNDNNVDINSIINAL